MKSTAFVQLLPLILLFVLLYAFMIIPERKKKKKYDEMIKGIKLGDKVMTRGGVYGRITNIDEKNDMVVIETGPDRMRITFTKTAIGSVVEQGNGKEIEERKPNKKSGKRQEKQNDVKPEPIDEVATDTTKGETVEYKENAELGKNIEEKTE